jgi:pyrroline-5-carboxylate reductase
MSFKRISVIGAGVMGEALISALIKAGHQPENIEIIEKREERCQELVNKYLIKIGKDLSSMWSYWSSSRKIWMACLMITKVNFRKIR